MGNWLFPCLIFSRFISAILRAVCLSDELAAVIKIPLLLYIFAVYEEHSGPMYPEIISYIYNNYRLFLLLIVL